MDDGDDIVDSNDSNEQNDASNVEESNNVQEINEVEATKDVSNSQIEGVVKEVDGMNISEKADEIKGNMIDKYGDKITDTDFMNSNPGSKVHGYTDQAYKGNFNAKDGVIGHTDMKTGEIHVIAGTKEGTIHTLSHEMHHAASNHSDVTQVDEKTGNSSRTISAGVHDITIVTDKDGNVIDRIDHGRNLNEGITESLTVEFMNEYQIEGVHSYEAYHDNTIAVNQLCDIVGKETVENAYFQGDKASLETSVNYYAQNENAYEQLNNSLDIINNSTNPNEIAQARSTLDELMTNMQANKIEMEEGDKQ